MPQRRFKLHPSYAPYLERRIVICYSRQEITDCGVGFHHSLRRFLKIGDRSSLLWNWCGEKGAVSISRDNPLPYPRSPLKCLNGKSMTRGIYSQNHKVHTIIKDRYMPKYYSLAFPIYTCLSLASAISPLSCLTSKQGRCHVTSRQSTSELSFALGILVFSLYPS